MKGQERVINPQTNWMKSVAIFSVCPEGTYGAGCSQNCTCNTLNTASCNSTTGACVCKAGWEGETCSDDVDECNTSPASLTVCPDHSVCTNTNGSFLCLCLKGFYKSQSLCLGKDKFVLTIYPVLLSLSSSSSSLVFALPLSYSSASKQSETKLTASRLKQVQSTKVSKQHLFVFNFLVTHWPPHPPHWITFPTVPFTRSIFPQSPSPGLFSHSQPHQITFPTVLLTGSLFPQSPSPNLFPQSPSLDLFPQSPSPDLFSHSHPHQITFPTVPLTGSLPTVPLTGSLSTVPLTWSVFPQSTSLDLFSPQSPSPDLFPQSTSPDHFSHSPPPHRISSHHPFCTRLLTVPSSPSLSPSPSPSGDMSTWS